jgi:hypothetical protein
VVSIEKENNHQATTQKSITVTVNPVADMPVLTVNDKTSGMKITNIPLFIEIPELIDQDGYRKATAILQLMSLLRHFSMQSNKYWSPVQNRQSNTRPQYRASLA